MQCIDGGRTDNYQATWLYDGDCVLCDGAIGFTLRHEKAAQIQFISIQSPNGCELARMHGIDPSSPESFLFISNGKACMKSDGVIELSTYLRGTASVVRFGWIIPRPLRDWLYTLIARNRYKWFGKKQRCIIPDDKHRARFVL